MLLSVKQQKRQPEDLKNLSDSFETYRDPCRFFCCYNQKLNIKGAADIKIHSAFAVQIKNSTGK